MVSMVENNELGMDPIVPKHEPGPDGSMSPSVSTPEEVEPLQDAAQTQKRKGGRKPVRNSFLNSGAPHSCLSSCVTVASYRMAITSSDPNPPPDICYLRRAQATQPPGPGRLP